MRQDMKQGPPAGPEIGSVSAMGELVYQNGKLAPLGPTYGAYWMRNPRQRPLVNDFRLAASQRSNSCYCPEFHLGLAGNAVGSSPSPAKPKSARPSSPYLIRHAKAQPSLRAAGAGRPASPVQQLAGTSRPASLGRPGSTSRPASPDRPASPGRPAAPARPAFSARRHSTAVAAPGVGRPTSASAARHRLLHPRPASAPQSHQQQSSGGGGGGVQSRVLIEGQARPTELLIEDILTPSLGPRPKELTNLWRENLVRPGSASVACSDKVDAKALQRSNTAVGRARTQSRAADGASPTSARTGHGGLPTERQLRAASKMSNDHGPTRRLKDTLQIHKALDKAISHLD